MKLLQKFQISNNKKQRGASLVEAAFLIALISLVAMGAARNVGNAASNTFGQVNLYIDTSSGQGNGFGSGGAF